MKSREGCRFFLARDGNVRVCLQVALDRADLESLFAKDTRGDVATAAEGAKARADKRGPTLLLDGKRQQNVGIALARFHIEPEDIRRKVRAAVLRAGARCGTRTVNDAVRSCCVWTTPLRSISCKRC